VSPLVRAEEVCKTLGEGALATPVLHAVNLAVDPGELVLLMGPSGSGKTTLISILAGLLRATSGKVELCGAPISELDEAGVAAVRRQRLGFVFQTYNLFPALTARDNVALGYRMRGFSRDEARKGADRALDALGLGARAEHRPGELSSGQKQRIAVARAMAGDPPLVIGDEVTAALDSTSATAVMELMRSHVSESRAVLVVTHDRRLERYAHRVIEMEDGRIIRERAPATEAA
jgi:putative ABC transport system ATP-binding protein